MVRGTSFLMVIFGRALVAVASPTVLQPGDVQIVALASDSPDAFGFVTWVDIAAGTEVFFTDKGWGCSGFQSGESIIRYTATSSLPAGSVRGYEKGLILGPEWVVEQGSVSLSSVADQLIVYQGTTANPTPIFAFDTTGGWEDCEDVNSYGDSAIPTGLVDGQSAVSFAHSDNFWYRPWYSTSAVLETLKDWMTDRKRFVTTSSRTTRQNEYTLPSSFTILSGQRGVNGYTEYIPGNAPCIGHDGDLFPSTIDDRNDGCYDGVACDWDKTCSPKDSSECRAVTLSDENTQDMARRAVDYFEAHTGGRCHVVINRLARIKLDPNREIEQAAQFDAQAIQTYTEFHQFVSLASTSITSSTCGAGLLVDFHGHVHPEARIEMGYKLTSTQLRMSDAIVDGLAYTSSIKNLPTHTSADLSARGSASMGALFELPTTANVTGYLSVPSPTVTAPLVG